MQQRAYRAYFFGLAFVVLSMFLLGGVATRRLGTGGGQNVTFILILYLTLGIVVLGVMATRYVQHKYIASRAKRQASGEVIAKKRMSKAELNRFILFGASGMFAFLALVAGVLTFLGVLPIQGKYGTDFMILAFLVGFGPYGFYRGKQIKRIRSMDDKFPDFLRDLAESERAGMTLPRALQTAAKGLYGGLTGEVRHMSAQVSWGVSFTDAIQRFAKRVNTPLISRTVALIVEASRAGGNVIDILTAASDDAREIKQIVDERKRQMGIYGIIVYIAFFVFLVVIFVLSKQFLPAFSAAAKAGEGSELGGGGIKSFDVESFVTVFFHSALVQGIGGGLVSGVMQEGHPLGGLKHAVILTIVSWIVFRLFVDDLLSKLLGG
ncbi:MAG: type II secretion system F family protein [Euryarchaeota archaeon]|nr:type II secretion system F family protein [Euryarchaeota archaeon]